MPPLREIGSSGLNQWGGFVREEILRDLQGQRGMRAYREMGDNDDIVGACLFAIERLAGQVDWRVESADERKRLQQPQQPAGNSSAAGQRQGEAGIKPQSGARPLANSPKGAKPAGAKPFGVQKTEFPGQPRGAGAKPKPRTSDPPEDPQPERPPIQTQEDEKAEFLKQVLFEDMNQPWAETVNDILSMLQYGFAPLELVYKRRTGPDAKDPSARSSFTDGRIGWAKWALRAQDTVYRWVFNERTGDVEGVVQKTQDRPEVTIPSQKFLLFRTSARRQNPEGRSILRPSYTSWFFKRRIKEIEGIGIERDLAGLPVLTAPEGVDLWNPNDTRANETLDYAKKLVTGIRVDEQGGVVLPFGWVLEAFKGGGDSKKIDVNLVITRYDQRIAMTMLADFILIGHEQVGSKALADTKLKGFAMALTAFLDHIEAVVNRVAIPRLWELNGWPLEDLPQLRHGEVDDVDLAELGAYIQQLAAAGVPLFPNVRLEEYLHQVAKLPGPPEGFEERALQIQADEQAQAEADAEAAAAQFDLQAQEVDAKTKALLAKPKPVAGKPRRPLG